MDDMNKLIKNLSAKVNRLEIENKNLSRHMHEGNPNQFRKLLYLGLYLGRGEIMIFKGRGKKVNIRGYNLLSRIIY